MTGADTDLSTSNAAAQTKGASWIQLLAAAALAFLLVFMLTPNGAAVSPDSLAYLDIAGHIHAGDGAKSSDYSLEYAGENRVVDNTTWPPLYPAVLAIGTKTPDVFTAATWSAILLTATLFFVQRILSAFLSLRMTLLAGLPLALAAPMLTIHAYVWSEQLFVTLLAAAFLVTQRYLLIDDRDGAINRWLIAVLALLLIAVFFTRYIGILFFPVLPLLYLSSGRPHQFRLVFSLACLACAGAAIALMAYNLHISGSVTGTSRAGGQGSLLEQLLNLVSALLPSFFTRGNISVVGLFALFATALSWLTLRDRTLPERRSTAVTASLAFGLALYYLGCVVVLRSLVEFDDIDVRLTSAAVMFGWVGCVALAAAFALRPWRMVPAMIAMLAIFAVVANGYSALMSAREQLRTTGSPNFQRNASVIYFNHNLPLAANQYRNFMAPLTNPDSVILVDRPAVLGYLTGLASYDLPKTFSNAEIRKLVTMPPRSYMLVSEEERAIVEQKLRELGVRLPATTVAADRTLLHLPLEMEAAAE